jgi:hypothetical protein
MSIIICIVLGHLVFKLCQRIANGTLLHAPGIFELTLAVTSLFVTGDRLVWSPIAFARKESKSRG